MQRFGFLILPIFALGCGGVADAPPLAPVSGTVMMGGKPLPDATVGFHLEGSAPRAGIGKTDAEGKFRITTFNTNDGAIVGTHTVTVAKVAAAAGESGDMEVGGDDYGKAMTAAASGAPPKQTLPEQYATKETSLLKVTVPAAGNTNVELTIE